MGILILKFFASLLGYGVACEVENKKEKEAIARRNREYDEYMRKVREDLAKKREEKEEIRKMCDEIRKKKY